MGSSQDTSVLQREMEYGAGQRARWVEHQRRNGVSEAIPSGTPLRMTAVSQLRLPWWGFRSLKLSKVESKSNHKSPSGVLQRITAFSSWQRCGVELCVVRQRSVLMKLVLRVIGQTVGSILF